MSKRILVLLSSATEVPLREGGTHKTGIFLGELVEPLAPLIQSGYEIDFVSPKGKPATIDSNSENLMYWGFLKQNLREGQRIYKQLLTFGMANPMSLEKLLLDENLLDAYDLLFVPGGHGPMTDLLHEDWLKSDELNQNVGQLLNFFHNKEKLIALICHAPSILASAQSSNGKCTFDGYKATCVTGISEWITEDAPLFKVVKGHLKAYPESILRDAGIQLSQNPIPMISHVVEDRNLITGQDPYAARALGQMLLSRLMV